MIKQLNSQAKAGSHTAVKRVIFIFRLVFLQDTADNVETFFCVHGKIKFDRLNNKKFDRLNN